mgnify:CR=1 FL=1
MGFEGYTLDRADAVAKYVKRPLCRYARGKLSERPGRGVARVGEQRLSGGLALIGIFAMRWNVVVGGQFFSKSLRGFTTYKMELVGREGLFSAILVGLLPLVILAVLLYLLPPWEEKEGQAKASSPAA